MAGFSMNRDEVTVFKRFSLNMTTLAYILLGVLLLAVIAGLLLLYYARDYAAPVPPAIPGTVRIACVGDSITFGALVKNRGVNCYPAQLETLLGAGYSVRNFGVNGHAAQKSADEPYWEHHHFSASSEFAPDIVLLMLGTNDAADHNWKGIAPFIADYRELVAHYAELPSHPAVYIMTPPTQFAAENYTKVIYKMNNDRLDEMTASLIKLADELGTRFIDINAATKNHPEFFCNDGLHPDAGGAALIAETVYKALTSPGT
jgi:lysophospholipase L1-like esterase